MEYLLIPVSDDRECFYSRRENTNPLDFLKTIRGDYVMIDTDDYQTFRQMYGEGIKTDTKFILKDGELEFLYDIDPQILHNMTHLLIAYHNCNGFIEYFHELKSLKYLEITCYGFAIEKIIDKLPHGLESFLVLDNYHIHLKPVLFDHLPITLKYLVIDGQNTLYNKGLNLLPIHLEVLILKIINFDQPLDNLPPNLKILAIKSRDFNQSLTNLPASLEYLALLSHSCHHPLKYTKLLTNLPSGLKHCILDHNIYYDNKDSILATNPNCFVSNNKELALQNNIIKLYGTTSYMELLHI